MTEHTLPSRSTQTFAESVDVIVVGYGFAGAVSAITAHDAGAQVLVVEKMPDPGGISICSGGGLRLSHDSEAMLAYLRATNDGTTPEGVLRTFVDEMRALDAYVEELARINGATLVRSDRPGNYPFPSCESMYFLQVDTVPGFEPQLNYPHARALSKGPFLFKVLEDNLKARTIEVRLSTPVVRLITGHTGEVCGVWLQGPDGLRAVRARRGVILACGGFEADAAMQRQFWQLKPVFSAAFQGNTGDGIRMALDVGADLWHMWHFHGTYGFHVKNFPFAIRTKRLPDWVPEIRDTDAVMSWILVDRQGRRFMNEYEPYVQDTGHRPLDRIDPMTMRFPNVPCYLIVDEVGRQQYPLGQSVFNDRTVTPYEWSQDNMKEVGNGILQQADTLADLAELIGCEGKTLDDTLAAWNAACAAGSDTRFGRPPQSMLPLRTPPFYIGEIWPVVSNTQGGPVHDAQQRILNPYGTPIPRLFAAGELGGIWGHLYISGGNLTECFVGGRVAGREAAALTATPTASRSAQ